MSTLEIQNTVGPLGRAIYGTGQRSVYPRVIGTNRTLGNNEQGYQENVSLLHIVLEPFKMDVAKSEGDLLVTLLLV